MTEPAASLLKAALEKLQQAHATTASLLRARRFRREHEARLINELVAITSSMDAITEKIEPGEAKCPDCPPISPQPQLIRPVLSQS
jgi:hypothetical protein